MSTVPARRRAVRGGTTLVELLVVLAVLGVMTSVAGLAIHGARAVPSAEDVALDRIAAARRAAIATGLDVSTVVMRNDQPGAVTAHADGRVLADSQPALDPLSGRMIPREHHDARP